MAVTLLWTPSVLLCGGMKSVKNGRSYHEASVIRAPNNSNDERLKKMADELRKLGDAAFRAHMLTKTLD